PRSSRRRCLRTAPLFVNAPPPPDVYPLSLHDALPISRLTYTTSGSAPAACRASRISRSTGTKAWQGAHQSAPKYSATMRGSRSQRYGANPAPSGRTSASAISSRSASPAPAVPQAASSRMASARRQAIRTSEVPAQVDVEGAGEARTVDVIVVAPRAGFQVLLPLVEQVAHAHPQVP